MVTISGAYTLNTWHQFVGTYDGSNLRLYIDGALATAAVPQTGNVLAPGVPMMLGSLGSGQLLEGRADDDRLWPTRALTAQEILDWYNGGRGYEPSAGDVSVTPAIGVTHSIGIVPLLTIDGNITVTPPIGQSLTKAQTPQILIDGNVAANSSAR